MENMKKKGHINWYQHNKPAIKGLMKILLQLLI